MEIPRFPLADGVVPHVRRGPVDGLPTVLVPGLSDGLAPLVRERGRALVHAPAPDGLEHLSGHLVSHRMPLPVDADVPLLADDLARFVEEVVRAPAVLSGHSLGGLVALRVAARRPELVRAVVASGCGLRPSDALDARLGHWEELLEAGRFDDWAADAVEVASTGPELVRRREVLRLLGTQVDADLVPRHVALSRAVRTWDASQDAVAATCPVLVMTGTQDPLVPIEQAQALADALPDAHLERFEGLAHGFPEQAPDRFARTLATFLRGRVPAPALGWSDGPS